MSATAYLGMALIGLVIAIGGGLALMNHYAHKQKRNHSG